MSEEIHVLSTHELIQAQHNENLRKQFGSDQKTMPPMRESTQKHEPIVAIQIMLQAIMDKLVGLNEYVRQNDLKYKPQVYRGEKVNESQNLQIKELSDGNRQSERHSTSPSENNQKDI